MADPVKYKTVPPPTFANATSLETLFNSLGSNGWDYVTFVTGGTSSLDDGTGTDDSADGETIDDETIIGIVFQAAPMGTMIKYKVVEPPIAWGESYLNMLGAQGWELIEIQGGVLIFKSSDATGASADTTSPQTIDTADLLRQVYTINATRPKATPLLVSVDRPFGVNGEHEWLISPIDFGVVFTFEIYPFVFPEQPGAVPFPARSLEVSHYMKQWGSEHGAAWGTWELTVRVKNLTGIPTNYILFYSAVDESGARYEFTGNPRRPRSDLFSELVSTVVGP